MRVSIIGTNGMLSTCITKGFYNQGYTVDTYGLNAPIDYPYSSFTEIDLLNESFDYERLINSNIIVYTAGAGVQAALNTESTLMYKLNLAVPVEITIKLKINNYKGVYISFGSYMEIGLNDDDGKKFSETEVVCSSLPVTNDYALSKRLYSRYMNDLNADYTFWHFILPNMFSYDDIKPGTRLIPYVLNYLIGYNKGLNQKKPSFSAGLQTRQYILMEEILIVISKAIEKSISPGIYNIGGGEFISIRKLIERLFTIYNVPFDNGMFGNEVRRDGDVRSLMLNSSKLLAQINYLPNKLIEDIKF